MEKIVYKDEAERNLIIQDKYSKGKILFEDAITDKENYLIFLDSPRWDFDMLIRILKKKGVISDSDIKTK